jgi:hypothetical protein
MDQDYARSPKKQKHYDEQKLPVLSPLSKNIFLSPSIFNLLKMDPCKGGGLRSFLGPYEEHDLYVVMCSSLLCAKARQRNSHRAQAFQKTWPTVLSLHNRKALRLLHGDDLTHDKYSKAKLRVQRALVSCSCGTFSYDFKVHGQTPYENICKESWKRFGVEAHEWESFEEVYQANWRFCCRDVAARCL